MQHLKSEIQSWETRHGRRNVRLRALFNQMMLSGGGATVTTTKQPGGMELRPVNFVVAADGESTLQLQRRNGGGDNKEIHLANPISLEKVSKKASPAIIKCKPYAYEGDIIRLGEDLFTVVGGTAMKQRDSCRMHCHLPAADTMHTQSAPCGWSWYYVASVNKNNACNITLYHAQKDAKWDNTTPTKDFDSSIDAGLRDFTRYDMEPYPEIEIPFRLKGSTGRGNYTNLTAKYELSAYPLENTIGFLRMAEFDAGKVGFYRDHLSKTVQADYIDKTFYDEKTGKLFKQHRLEMLGVNMMDQTYKTLLNSCQTENDKWEYMKGIEFAGESWDRPYKLDPVDKNYGRHKNSRGQVIPQGEFVRQNLPAKDLAPMAVVLYAPSTMHNVSTDVKRKPAKLKKKRETAKKKAKAPAKKKPVVSAEEEDFEI